MSIVRAWKRSVSSSRNMLLQTDGHQKPLAVCGIDKVVATWSLMLMQRVRQHGNEHCPASLRCLPLDAALMPFVRLVIADASEVRWCAHAPPPFRCTPANGSA